MRGHIAEWVLMLLTSSVQTLSVVDAFLKIQELEGVTEVNES